MANRMNRKALSNDGEKRATSRENIKQYKNQNVLFKIHSPDGEQDYHAKRFPAKFSINISNETRGELANGAYDLDHPELPRKAVLSPRKKLQMKGTNEFDEEFYEKCLREGKAQYERLAREADEMVDKYENYIEELKGKLKDFGEQNSKLREMLGDLQRKQREGIINSDSANRRARQQLQNKVRRLEHQNRRLKNKLKEEEDKNYENRIKQLESIIEEKEAMIKKISKMNDDVYQKMMRDQESSSSAQIKDMEKWLRNMNKVFSAKSGDIVVDKQKGEIVLQNNKILQLVHKYEEMENLILKLEIRNQQLQKENSHLDMDKNKLIRINESLKEEIEFLIKRIEEKERQQQTQETFYKKTISSSASQSPSSEPLDGTVRVKMQILLLEKDKRIGQLQNELQQMRRQNISLQTKLVKDDYEQDFISEAFRQTGNPLERHFSQTADMQIARSKSFQNLGNRRMGDTMTAQDYQSAAQIKQMYNSIDRQYKKFNSTLNKFLSKGFPMSSDGFSHAYNRADEKVWNKNQKNGRDYIAEYPEEIFRQRQFRRTGTTSRGQSPPTEPRSERFHLEFKNFRKGSNLSTDRFGS